MREKGGAGFRDDTLDRVAQLNETVDKSPEAAAEDEGFWLQVQAAFDLDRRVVNFNNGGCSPSPRVVQEFMSRQFSAANQAPSLYMWRDQQPEIEGVRRRLAKTFGCDSEELAVMRNASEALETCLFGLSLERGDEVLTTNLDYPRMIHTIKQRERRDGVVLIQADIPPISANLAEIAQRIEQRVTKRTKAILISHVSFMNGQIFPVAKIVEWGHQIDVPVIIDGAHAYGQLPFGRDELNCDYYGASLHKWMMAPIGTGFLYIRRELISTVWSLMASRADQAGDIRKFEEIGTHPAATYNAIGEALDFHELIGVERKAARLRYLRRLWTQELLEEKKVRFFTDLAPENSCGLTTVEIMGIEPAKLSQWLLEKHAILVTSISAEDFKGIRVTPTIYTTANEIARFKDAMIFAARNGID